MINKKKPVLVPVKKSIKKCSRCPYKIGLIKTFTNPCIQCNGNSRYNRT